VNIGGKKIKQNCDRCGTCCTQGGAALHSQDLPLVRSGSLRFEHLVTVRKGELAYQPLAREASSVEGEFLKLQGKAGSWACLFYAEQTSSCTIYEQRPMACALLDCMAPEALLEVAGKELLTRFDCMGDDDPLRPLVQQQEERCPCPDLSSARKTLQNDSQRPSLLELLTRMVNLDLSLRRKAGAVKALTVAEELFYFGRPLFQLVSPLGVQVQETSQGLKLL